MSENLNANLAESLKSIHTRPLFVMRLDVKPLQMLGTTPDGVRRIGIVTGGVFEGERLSGTITDGGSDWQFVRPDGSTTLDVRVVLQTDDGALIGMTYGGVRAGPPEVLAQLAKGEPVDPANYYFRTTARFETSAEKYDWLNRIVAVGTGHRYPAGPVYSLFEVL
jgi:hypothetical protein